MLVWKCFGKKVPLLIEFLLPIQRNREFLLIWKFNADFEVLLGNTFEKCLSSLIKIVLITWRR